MKVAPTSPHPRECHRRHRRDAPVTYALRNTVCWEPVAAGRALRAQPAVVEAVARLKSTHPSAAGAGTQDAPHERYAERLFTWVNETFPHPDHKCARSAQPDPSLCRADSEAAT